MQEAKHDIYRDCLGYSEFKIFDGVRFGYKGVQIVTFKLKEQTDVDGLIDNQFNIELKFIFQHSGTLTHTYFSCFSHMHFCRYFLSHNFEPTAI